MAKDQSTNPLGPFLVRTTKGSILIQTTDQVRDYLAREDGSVLEISSTVQNWKLNVEQARNFFKIVEIPASTSQQLAHLATQTTDISDEIVCDIKNNQSEPQEQNVKNGKPRSPIRVHYRQEVSKRGRQNPHFIGIFTGSVFLIALGLLIAPSFIRSNPQHESSSPSQLDRNSALAIAQESLPKSDPGAKPPEALPATSKIKITEFQTPKQVYLKPAQTPIPAANSPVSDLIAINSDHFSRRISWTGQFKVELDSTKPTIPCLMRVQNMAADDPFLWSSAILIYRVDRGNGMLLRIVEFINGEKNHRREYDYLSSPVTLHGTKHFVLDLYASTDLARGRVRMWVDDHPVTWSKLAINDIAHPQRNQEKTISTMVISGDVPTLFSARARWIARGDSDSPVYNYILTANYAIPGFDP